MADIIATHNDAEDIGGVSGEDLDMCLTKYEVQNNYNCAVVGTYTDTQLVCLKDLYKARTIIFAGGDYDQAEEKVTFNITYVDINGKSTIEALNLNFNYIGWYNFFILKKQLFLINLYI